MDFIAKQGFLYMELEAIYSHNSFYIFNFNKSGFQIKIFIS